jgi:hypothetical protein
MKCIFTAEGAEYSGDALYAGGQKRKEYRARAEKG